VAFIDTSKLPAIERLQGWRGRYFDSASMPFAHYQFDAGSSIHEHSHPQEEVYEVIEGEVEITIGKRWAQKANAPSGRNQTGRRKLKPDLTGTTLY